MGYLFDTDAISELLRRRPAQAFVDWLSTIPRELQYTSAVVVGELYKGAFRSSEAARHLLNIENRVLPALTVLPYDIAIAREFGRLRAFLEDHGEVLPDADIQIAATAIYHNLELVTGNLRHFERFEELYLSKIFAEARGRPRK